MGYVKYINKNVQQTLKSRERALAWKASNANESIDDGSLRPKDMSSRTTFLRMCSNKVNDTDNILIKGGELNEKGEIQFGVQLGDKGSYKATTIGKIWKVTIA